MEAVIAPADFDETFLEWFRAATEDVWAAYRSQTFEEYQAWGTGGQDWQAGTRWVGGLSDAEIEAAERRWSVRFPPDYRLFLRRLHTVDRPMVGAYYEGDVLVATERPSFYDWRIGREGPPGPFTGVLAAFQWLFRGLELDVERAGLWLPSWGAKPPTAAGRADRLRSLLAAAPTIIPVFNHRYLLADPSRPGNPVLSAWQSDIVVYGSDLRDYLPWEFAHLLPRDPSEARQRADEHFARCEATYDDAIAIPFWGEIIAHRSKR